MDGRYEQITETRLSPKRALVVSRYAGGGYMIAQRVKYIQENGEEVERFCSNAIMVSDVDGLQNIVNMLSETIKKEKK